MSSHVASGQLGAIAIGPSYNKNVWIQWHSKKLPAYSDTFLPSKHCYCKRGGLYLKSELNKGQILKDWITPEKGESIQMDSLLSWDRRCASRRRRGAEPEGALPPRGRCPRARCRSRARRSGRGGSSGIGSVEDDQKFTVYLYRVTRQLVAFVDIK